MKSWVILNFVVATMAVIGLAANQAYSTELSTNSQSAEAFFSSEAWTNAVLMNNAVADLGTQFNWNANEDAVSDFDKQVCKSLGMRSRLPMLLSYKEVSLVFHSPKTNEWLVSSQQMGGALYMIYQDGKLVRTNSQEQLPGNYIWLFDPNVKELNVEIDLLLSVAPAEKLQDVKYARRSFRFVYRNRHWVND